MSRPKTPRWTGRGPHVETWAGVAYHPLAPLPDEVLVADIIQSSCINNRYNGHTNFPISVAQHSVLVSRLIAEHLGGSVEMQRWGLLHDAAECYVGDMVRPLKIHMHEFTHVEDCNMAAIAARFSLGPCDHVMLKEADNFALMLEVASARDKHTTWGPDLDAKYEWALNSPEAEPFRVVELTWRQARTAFSSRFRELFRSEPRAVSARAT